MNLGYDIRAAKLKDAAIIAHHRAAMFRDMGELNDEDAATLEAESLVYFTELIPANKYFGWVGGKLRPSRRGRRVDRAPVAADAREFARRRGSLHLERLH